MPIPAHPPFLLTFFPLPARPFCFLTVSITVYMSSLQQADLAFIASLSLRVEPFGLAIDCPTCGGTVPITICVSDKHGNAGKPMAKHPLCSYYHFFPLLLSRPGIMALIPSSSSSPTLASSSTLSSSAPSLSQAPLLSQAKKTRKRGAECTTNPCRRPRALRCPRGKCLSHCIEEGGCVVHEIPVYDDNEQDNTVDGAGFGYHDLHNALSASLAAQGLEVPPPLPAIVPSLHDILHAPAPPPPPPSLLPAPSTLKTSKHPRITSQLDPLWEQDLHQRAQQEIEDNRVAQRRKEMELKSKQRFILNWFDADDVPASRQWVSNCPFFPFFQLADDPDILPSLGENITKIEVFEDRLQQWIPAKLTHDFPLESECHIFIRRFGVTSCHDFNELYDASRASMRPAHLRYNMKRERDGIRTKIKAKHVVHVSSVPPDLLSDDVEIIDDTSVASDFVSDNVEFIDDADDLIEVVDDVHATPRPTNALGKRARDTASPAYTSTRPRFDDWDSRRASSMSPTPSLSPSPAESSTSVSSISLVSAVPSVIPVHVPSYKGNSKHVWPHGMFTCDMVVGFRQMDSPLLRVHYPQEELFGLIFGVPYVRATYHSNHALWVNSSKVISILQAHEHAHRAPDGLWAHYLSSRRAALGEKTKKRSGPKFK
ncbi:hypothetical protein DEU56DRAFT_918349 [Suillus clintonianus]|uniref:uncharacterized protein n=1 Tax=Suillus clintonianus TaxID=1904413 RepID=UPI001B8747FD|nr:uncharacterized protein DEU56DRAFT_918349 [Suillus clintonianus]KAG2121111.1 hypothetical protein DEU56DRAFT_918349 [Suillus clintonianus]